MYKPTFAEFKRLAEHGNLIPIYKEILADLETPVSAFKKLREGEKFAFLLESVEGGERVARYSFLGSDPFLIVRSKGDKWLIEENGEKREEKSEDDPLRYLERMLKRYKPIAHHELSELPRFYGGAVGYLSYDMVRYFEKLPDLLEDDLHFPDCAFLLTDTILVFDHVKHKIKIVANVSVDSDLKKAYHKALDKIEAIEHKLKSPQPYPNDHQPKPLKVESNFSREEFIRGVEKIKDYIRAGDIIQAVFSQRFATTLSNDSFDVYRALRSINPSPYMFYLKFDDFSILGSSPELLVRVEDDRVQYRPLAGTRRRGETPKEDKQLEEELLADEKERAEHVMLVDLGRNDIGRVCGYGTVKVSELMAVERYSHVMHIVSNVEGQLRPDKTPFDALRACFPAGTVTGAPKIRAMEIIEELEPVRRGPYAGSVGYLGFSGNLDTCITIRTIIVKGDKAYVQAGAGIVADSDPESEYQETANKAKALLTAIEVAERGL